MILLMIVMFSLAFQVQSVTSEQSTSQAYRRYVDKSLAIQSSAAATYSKEENEIRCISKCSLDSECSAAAFDDISKNCTLNRCGRSELVASPSSTVSIKG